MCPELTRDTIPRSRDVGHFLSVTGTVIRTSAIKVTNCNNYFFFINFYESFIIWDVFEGKNEQQNVLKRVNLVYL